MKKSRGKKYPSERSPSISYQDQITGRDVHLARSHNRRCSYHRSNRAQDSEQFLIIRAVGLVYVREHRSNVGTIEQILFKYGRERKRTLYIYKQGWKSIHNKYKQM